MQDENDRIIIDFDLQKTEKSYDESRRMYSGEDGRMIWTEESARLFFRAYRCGMAGSVLAEKIAPHLERNAHVCDAGCGVGSLSLALAGRGFRVTAVDIDVIPLAQLRGAADTALSDRMEILCADVRTLETPFDAMVFCFFGDIESCLRVSRRLCRGDVFYVSRNYEWHRFSAGRHPVRYKGYRDARQTLDTLGIPYTWEELALDMSQPFESMDEARRFFELYNRDEKQTITDSFLKERLTETAAGEYPLLLPHIRRAGMVRFRAKDIPGCIK